MLADVVRRMVMGASIKSLQSGQIGLSGVASVDVNITAVDLTKAFLLFDYRMASASTGEAAALRGKFVDADTIRFQRQNTSGTPTVAWYVIEFGSGVTVAAYDYTQTANPVTVSITTVDPARAFVVGSAYLSSGSFAGGVQAAHSYYDLAADGASVDVGNGVGTAMAGTFFVVEFD